MSKNIEQTVQNWVQEYLTDKPNLFLVDARRLPPNRISILLDGEPNVSIEECTSLNRALGHWLEEQNLIPNAYILEVGSPGLDKPLLLPRQYIKNIGRLLKVQLHSDSKKIEGRLTEANETKISLEVKTKEKGKKSATEILEIAISDVKEAKIQIEF